MIGVNQFVGRGRRLCQNAQPSKRVHALVSCQNAFGNARTANAMKAIAARNEIALYCVFLRIFPEVDDRTACGELAHTHILDLEQYLSSRGQSGICEVLHDLGLGINRNSLPACQFLEIDAMALAVES